MCSRASRLLSCASQILCNSSTSISRRGRVLEYRSFVHVRAYSTDNFPKKLLNKVEEVKDEDEQREQRSNLSGAIGSQYQTYRDEDASVVFDVDEERKRMIDLETVNALHEFRDPYEGLNMKRGVKGVYDIEDLVDLLRRDKAKDIFVASVPEEMSYVDYIVVVTAKSGRHMSALATFVRKVFKIKANAGDLLPKIEGSTCNNWVALDLGNIALHIFSKSARLQYDLETLWTVGGRYDSETNKPNAEEFHQSYDKFLSGLRPADE